MNIKIGEVVIENVNMTDSGDLLGMQFMTTMRLGELEELFTPGSYPEFRVVDASGEVTGVYKNRKQITLRVDNRDEMNEVNLALQVTPATIEEVEVLTAELSENTVAIAELGEMAATQEAHAGETDLALAELGAMAASQEERAGETDVALAELGILYADLLERVTALETANQESVVDEEVVEDETPVEENTDEPTV